MYQIEKTSEPSTPSEFITGFQCKADVAKRCKVSTRTIDSWMSQKKIPFIKVGRTVRFRWHAVEDALNRFEHKSIC